MSWVKGDRLRVTLEVIAEEPSDETGDVWFREGVGRSYLNLPDIKLAGGEYTLEVVRKVVKLPRKKWAQVIYKDASGVEILATTCIDGLCWHDIFGKEVSIDYIRQQYVRTLSEGVDE